MKKVICIRLLFFFLAASLVFLWGCATKKFVLQEMQPVNQKVADLDAQVKENQKWIQEHETKISQLSTETQKALADAKTAMSKAEEAQAMARGKLLYGVALKNENVRFDFDSCRISDPAKRILDEFISLVKSENKNIFIEIHGHTDSTGPEEYNMKLGQERAEAVKRYLFEKGIPLHKLSTISYGASQPIADNSSREGRANNRRVVILVLE